MAPGSKLALALAIAAVALLIGEGLTSLVADRSLLGQMLLGRSASEPGPGAGRGRSPAAGLPAVAPTLAPPGDDDRRRAALTNPGLYRVHRDPLVGYVLKADAEQQILEGRVRSDALGLRVRPGPPARAEGLAAGQADSQTAGQAGGQTGGGTSGEALRIAVLGDSVAFGYGLDDDQTLAHQLETQLAAARGASLPPVVARTVALPGWNHRNSVHCLLDHLDALDPDLVIYLPVGNDLIDTDGVWETGHRRAAPDIANPDPWLQVGVRTNWPFLQPLLAEAAAGADPGEIAARLGPLPLNSDLPGESRRRYVDNTDSLALLARTLAARGGRLLVVHYVESEYATHLGRHLHESGLALEQLPLFTSFPKPLQLADDPHPNAQAAGVMATLVAGELLHLGWVERGAGDDLPPVPQAYRELACAPFDAARVVADSDALRAEARARLRPALDFTSFEGVNQVYGTLNDDASAAMRLLVALAPGGARLRVLLAPLAARPDLYPMSVAVEVDGRRVGTLQLTADAPVEANWLLAPRNTVQTAHAADAETAAADSAAAPIEVRLLPDRWALLPQGSSSTLASFLPLRVAIEP